MSARLEPRLFEVVAISVERQRDGLPVMEELKDANGKVMRPRLVWWEACRLAAWSSLQERCYSAYVIGPFNRLTVYREGKVARPQELSPRLPMRRAAGRTGRTDLTGAWRAAV